MNRKTAGIVFTMGVGVSALTGTASAQNSPGSAALDTSLRGAVERKDVPGVVALVTDRDRVLYQSAFGVADVATGRPLTADALFRIASMTKPVTSVALMQLIEQGRIGLDDPAEKYLPELAGLKVVEIVRRGDRRLRAAPGIETADRQALPDPHVGTGLSVHQRDLARFQAARRRNLSVRRTAAVRSRRALALQHQHRRRRQAGRGGVRPEAGGLFPPAHLCPAEDGRHLLQRAGGQGAAPRRATAARRRAHGRRHRTAEAAARAHHRGADRRRRPRLDRRRLRALRAHAAQRRRSSTARGCSRPRRWR